VLQNFLRAQELYFFLTYRKSRNHLQAFTRMKAYHITEFGVYATKIIYSQGDRESKFSRLDLFSGYFAEKQLKNYIFNRIAFLGLRSNTSKEILEDLRKQLIFDG
jgi:hypothetical protein